MLNQLIRSSWDKALKPIGRSIGRMGISPNAITLLGLVVQGVAAAYILDGRLLVAGLVSIPAGLLDTLDGAVAKARGVTSRFGALLDSTVDRVSDAVIFSSLAWLYGVQPDVPSRAEPWVAALSLGTLVLSFLVSYVKARAEGLGYRCKGGLVERAERVIIVIAGLVFDLVPVSLAILFAASAVTFIQRLFDVRSQARSAD